jgi:hypothetical protein
MYGDGMEPVTGFVCVGMWAEKSRNVRNGICAGMNETECKKDFCCGVQIPKVILNEPTNFILLSLCIVEKFQQNNAKPQFFASPKLKTSKIINAHLV